MKDKKIIGYLLFCLLSLTVVLTSIFIIEHFIQESKLDGIQDEALTEIYDNKGQYAENKIVLYNTSESESKRFAELLGAKLRSTNNGEFATLTLPQGLTVQDVYSNKDYREYLDKFSLDYYGTISEEISGEEVVEKPEHTPSRPSPNYTSINDEYYASQTYLDYINLTNTWDSYNGNNVTVAVIDTGIDTDHPEFIDRISPWSYNASLDKIVKDYEDDWSLIEDEQGHGTAVAGVIAAARNNEIGITGIAPNIELLVIKCECDENGRYYNSSDLIFGLYYAIEQDVDVVNMSFGGDIDFSAPARLAVDSDIILVAAAGNQRKPIVDKPAALDEVIGVGALEENSWNRAGYSNYGEGIDIFAPGTVYTTSKGGGYETIHGTSFSSPIVASAAALYKSQNKYSTYKEFKEILHASSYDLGDLGKDFVYGFGALDVSALLLEQRCTVTFNYLTDEIDQTSQIFIKGHALQELPEPDRNYAVFDGWYYDIYCEEEVQWYEDIWNEDLTLYAKWCNEDDAVPYTYVTLEDNTIEIRSYTGHRRYITMPDYIDGKLVSSIGMNAFSGQSRLRQVKLPSYLVTIKENAFYECSNLVNISIPETVKYIGSSAFCEDARISTIVFEGDSKLEYIGNNAFAFTGIKEFYVPKNVSYLNGSAFFGTTRMLNYFVAKGNNKFTASNGVLYNSTASTVVAYPAGLSTPYLLPNSVKTIGVAAFAYTKLTSIDFNNVVVIEGSAFEYSSLETLNIKDSITTIGDRCFYKNLYLKEVTIGKKIKYISLGSFALCISLESITIPNNVEIIGKEAFTSSGLTSIYFESNSNLIEICVDAFSYTNLLSINFPKSLVYIGNGAFEYSSLESITFENGSLLKSIGSAAFFKNRHLNDISLPEGLITISNSAFEQCLSLSDIVLPNSLEYLGSYAFKDTGLSGEVNIPSKLTNMGANPFAACHQLSSIYVDEDNPTYQSIEGVLYSKERVTYSFEGNDFTPNKYALIVYPAGKNQNSYSVINDTNIIEHSAFYGCNNLNYIYLNLELEEIHKYAFSNCLNLWYLDIPDYVNLIAAYSFANTPLLGTINFGANSKLNRIGAYSFAQSGLVVFKVPSNVSSLAQYAFYECNNLVKITFSTNSKLSYISAYNFDGCDNLRDIIFEAGSCLSNIEAHAFENAINLQKVDFGDAHITNIDNYAFRYCFKLKTISIPEGVEYIGRYAFYGDYSLNQIVIPSSVQYIGQYAFYTKDNVIDVYFASPTLPEAVQENWDEGINGYYLDSAQIMDNGEFEYSLSHSGEVSIIKYKGDDEVVDLSSLSLEGDIVSIGGNAFAYTSVKSVMLPDTLKNISQYAFAYSKLESIDIPSSVTFIGKYAFYHCDALEEVIFNNSNVSRIEKYAFANTYSLNSINLPESLQYIGSYIFYKSGLTQVNFDENIGIKEISQNAFEGTKLTSVTIPNSVTLINHNAFRDIKSLTSVTWGSTNDFQLMSNVFYNTGLTGELYIPSNLTYIGEYSLVGLSNLNIYIVDENNNHYKSIDGVLYTKDGKKLINFPANREGSFTVPNHVETIGFGAFENSKLSSVDFEEGINLLTLGYRAFFNADNLASIDVPASVISIDYYAFAYCDNLETVNFAEDNQLKGIYEGAFYLDKSLKNIELPDSIVEISDFAFYGCQSLTKLPISDNNQLKGIFNYAFAYSGIKGDLIIPDTVIDLGDYAFKGTPIKSAYISRENEESLIIGFGVFNDCHNIEEITIPFTGDSYMSSYKKWFSYIFGAGSNEVSSLYIPETLKIVQVTGRITNSYFYDVFVNMPLIEKIELPYGINSIPYQAFKDCSNLSSIIIPDSVTEIDFYAFQNCFNLKFVNIPDNVTSIGYGAFFNCSNLTFINIPSSVSVIGSSSFEGCINLNSVIIQGKIESIPSSAFRSCHSLTSIIIPKSVSSIGSEAFAYCDNLETVIIEENSNLQSIENYAFNNCSSLTSISIPNSVRSIGASAFQNCSSLQTVNIEEASNLELINEGVFYNCSSLVSVSIPNSVTSIGAYAFYNCSNLQTVNIEERSTLVSISEYSFNLCSHLTSITIPSSVTSIAPYAFAQCTNITNVTIEKNSNINSIGENTFYNCSSLESIYVPAGVTTIFENTFYNCSKLKSIFGCDNVNTLGVNAFRFCSSLESISLPNVTALSDYAFCSCRSLKSLIVSNNINSIGIYALSGTGITSFLIPSNLVFIGRYAFSGCNNLEEITCEDSTSITSFEDFSFSYCASLKSFIIPSSITSIGNYVFYESGLTSIVIPNTVTSIGECVFSNCSSLKEVIYEEGTSISAIQDSLFANCGSLSSIVIPSSVTTIEQHSFVNCTKLLTFTIPSNVTSIGDCAFLNCVFTIFTNNSDLNMCIGDSRTNPLCIDTMLLIDKEGNEFYKDGCDEVILTFDGFVFTHKDGVYRLDSYKGEEETVTLPYSFNGNAYILNSFKGVENIVIPDGWTSINEGAFSYSDLISIYIPNSVLSIGNNAFSSCSHLEEVVFDEESNLEFIGNNAFYNCDSLTSISIPSSVNSIGYYAFSSCSHLEEVVFDEESNVDHLYNTFSGCSSLTSIKIPNSVTVIYNTFGNCSNLQTVIFEEGSKVEYIDYHAFYNCSSLTSISIPSSVISIWDYAFKDCSSLASVYFEEQSSLSYIGVCAFDGCSSLISLNVPDNVTTIGQSAFINCPYLIVNVSTNNDYFYSNNGILFNKDLTQIVYVSDVLTEIVIPKTVIRFTMSSNIEKVTFEEGTAITNIEGYSFSGCSNLKYVELPHSIVSIGSDAFSGCTNLTSITIPKNVHVIASSAFSGCSNLQAIIFEEDSNLESIQSYAFNNCFALIFINIPDSVNYIGYRAFYNCSSLVSINIPNNVTSIGNNAFENCSILQTVIFEEDSNIDSINDGTFNNCTNLESINIPDSVNYIGYRAFYNCSSLTSINLPNNLTKIESYSFYNCSSLTTVSIPGNVAIIDSYAFDNCTNLTNIYMASSVHSIGNYAFDNCSNLQTVIFEEDSNIDSINDGAFNNCTNLESINIPDSINYIGNRAFYNCSSLTSINLPNNLTKIESYSFYNCSSLTTVSIPESVTIIDSNAFGSCTSIKSIFISKNVVSIGGGAFSSCSELESVVIEDDSNLEYVGNYAFSRSKITSINLPNTVNYIGNYAFQVCASLTSINIPDGVTSLSKYVFNGCTSLTSINIPNSVTTIDDYAFMTSGLTSIVIPKSVVSIKRDAFENCSSLETIIFEEGSNGLNINDAFNYCPNLKTVLFEKNSYITSIGDYAFSSCSKLEEVIFEENIILDSIGACAFRDCAKLRTINLPNSVKSIGREAFNGCLSLLLFDIPASLETIYDSSFSSCHFSMVTNNSDLDIIIGDPYFSHNALCFSTQILINKDGTKVYSSEYDNAIVTEDGFVFTLSNEEYALESYIGTEDTITLPETINGHTYILKSFKGAKNVIIPSGWTSINSNAFYHYYGIESIFIPNTVILIESSAFNQCYELKSVTFEEGSTLEVISDYAFIYCTSLESINIPSSVISIGGYAFYNCYKLHTVDFEDGSNLTTINGFAFSGSSLSSIIIPSSVTYIGSNAFYNCANLSYIQLPDDLIEIPSHILDGTKIYQNNFVDGVLVINDYLFKVSPNLKSLIYDYKLFAYDAFEGTTLTSLDLIKVISSNDFDNINTLIIHNYKIDIQYVFNHHTPITLKTICLKDCPYKISTPRYFLNVSGVTIYVDEYKENLMWDHDTPDWNNSNKVYYKGEWILVNFYDDNGAIIDSQYKTISQIIQQPYVASVIDGEYSKVFVGWDLDDDGVVDAIPATSVSDINAKAIYKIVKTEFIVNFYGLDDELISSTFYKYGDIIVPPEVSYKGYTFLGWNGYIEGMTAESSLDIYSNWEHVGEHDYHKVTVPPTCIEEGYDLYTCDVCDDYYKDNIISPLGHDYGEWIIETEPTCIEKGSKYHECSLCHEREYEPISPLGHHYHTETTIEATCQHKGEITYTCERCNHIEKESIPMTDHAYEKEYVTHSFLKQLLIYLFNSFYGYGNGRPYIYQCSECGHIRTASEAISVKGVSVLNVNCDHILGDWTIVVEPTCIEDGLLGRYCDLCDGLVEAMPIEKTGIHNPAEKVNENIIVPTCTEDGSQDEVIYCSICHEELERTHVVDEHLGHDLIHHDRVEPTCTEHGHEAYVTCTRCDYSTFVEIEPLGHHVVVDQAIAPTCTESGLSEGSHCSICHELLVAQEVIPPLGHTPGEKVHENVINPTCIVDGSHDEVFYCTVCHEELERIHIVDEALGHDLVHHDRVEPTCTEHGHEAYVTCTRCDYSTFVEIEPLGHHVVVDQAIAPTCTESGLSEGSHCSVCHEILVAQEVIPATGHEYVFDHFEWSSDGKSAKAVCICSHDPSHIARYDAEISSYVKINPTCIDKGTTTYVATYLTNSSSFDIVDIPALGHNPGEIVYENIVNPTCTLEGSHDEITYCSICYQGIECIHVIDEPLGHDLIHHERIEPTCTEHGHEAYDTCSRCDHSTYVEIPPLGHTIVIDEGYSPTCTEDGLTDGSHCSVCHEILVEQEVIQALGHNYLFDHFEWSKDGKSAKAVFVCLHDTSHILKYDAEIISYIKIAPNCVDEGTTTYVATYLSYTDSVDKVDIPVLDHTPGEKVIKNIVNPTCISNGWHDECIYCTECGAQLEKIRVMDEALSHDLVHHDREEPTCTEHGHEAYDACTRCDYSTYVEIPPLAHTPGEKVKENIISNTCTLDGHHDEVTYCTVCHAELSRILVGDEAYGHEYVFDHFEWSEDYTSAQIVFICAHDSSHIQVFDAYVGVFITVNPTCTNKGMTTYIATYFNYSDHVDIYNIPALGHGEEITFNENIINPTCTEDGSHDEVTYCKVCNEELERIHVMDEALGHDLVHHNKVESTCTEHGHETYDTCTRCDYSTYVEIPPHGHNIVIDEAIEPTCDLSGLTEGSHCSICNLVIVPQEIIFAIDHVPGMITFEEVVEATCTSDGCHDEVLYCAVCHNEISRVHVTDYALGHDIIHHDKLEATCTEHGHNAYEECTRCDYTTYIDIAPIGHDYIFDHFEWSEDGKFAEAIFTCSHDSSHTVSYDAEVNSYIKIYPTCKNKGTTTYVATYLIYSDSIDKVDIAILDHNPGVKVFENIINPTCTLNGSHDEVTYCTVCHEELERIHVIDGALGHDLVHHERLEPTCTEHGHEAYDTCSRCDYSTFVEIEPLGHQWSEWVTTKEASEFEEGNEERECSVCHEKETCSIPVIDHEHNMIYIEAKEPTCTEKGNIAYYMCLGCGCLFIDALGEIELNIEDIEIPALGHDLIHHDRVEPTCTEHGHEAYDTCNRCDYSTYVEIDALGHEYVFDHFEWSEDGKYAQAVFVCSHDSSHIVNYDAEINSYIKVNPTCINKGTTTYIATYLNHNDSIDKVDIAALGHNPGEIVHENVINPTCTIDGSHDEVTYCTVCHEELERIHIIDEALGHDLIHHDRVEPTCTEHGHEAYDTCTRCDYSTFVEIEPLGHDYNISYMDWAEDMLSAQAVFICSHDSSHIVRYDADVFSSIVKQPTCTDKGTTSYVASYLGYIDCVDLDDIPVLGHNPGEIVHENVINPTCTIDGSHDEVTYCTVCHEELERNHVVDEALGHDLIHHERVEPTCTEHGHEAYDTCTRCDYSTYAEIEPLGHDYNFSYMDWAEDMLSAQAVFICSHDSSHIVRYDADVFSSIAKQPTCTDKGTTSYVASYLGYIDCIDLDDIPALGHNPGEIVHENVINPTCTLDGSHDEVTYCTVCHEELERAHVVDEALGHDLIHHERVEPTCTEHGHEAYDTCTRCDYSTYAEIEPLGHHYNFSYMDWAEDMLSAQAVFICSHDSSHIVRYDADVFSSIAKQPTCTDKGTTSYVASYLGYIDCVDLDDIPVLGHNPGEIVHENIVNPTCILDGSHDEVTYCTVCHEELERAHIVDEALGHDLIHHERVEPTCTEHGHEAYDTCTRCDYSTYAEIEPLGHTPGEKVHENIVNPTCTLDGSHDEVTYCTVCHEELERIQIIDEALGHDLIHHDRVEPTCTEHGHEAYDTCTRCDYSTYAEIEPLGHTPGEKVHENIVNPTCTLDGGHDEVTYCTVCHEELERAHVVDEALGHDFREWVTVIEPTFTEEGLKERICSRCGEKEYEDIAKLDAIPYFIEALESIDIENDSTSELFNKLKEAYEYYSYTENKDSISEQYDILLSFINEYNIRVTVINDNHEEVTNNILSIMIGVISSINLLGAGLYLIKRGGIL